MIQNGVQVNVHGFSEQDQVDLYSLTQDGASKSKQGLGKANAPKKVAGANWEGTKIRIGDSDSEPAEKDPSNDALDNGVHTDAQEEQTEPEMGVKQQAHSIVLPKSKQGPQADSSGKKRKKAKAASAAAPLKPSAGMQCASTHYKCVWPAAPIQIWHHHIDQASRHACSAARLLVSQFNVHVNH